MFACKLDLVFVLMGVCCVVGFCYLVVMRYLLLCYLFTGVGLHCWLVFIPLLFAFVLILVFFAFGLLDDAIVLPFELIVIVVCFIVIGVNIRCLNWS